MEIVLVKSGLIERSGKVIILAHGDDYDLVKNGLDNMKSTLAEPLLSPPIEEVAVQPQDTCSHDYIPSPFGCDQCTKCGKIR